MVNSEVSGNPETEEEGSSNTLINLGFVPNVN